MCWYRQVSSVILSRNRVKPSREKLVLLLWSAATRKIDLGVIIHPKTSAFKEKRKKCK